MATDNRYYLRLVGMYLGPAPKIPIEYFDVSGTVSAFYKSPSGYYIQVIDEHLMTTGTVSIPPDEAEGYRVAKKEYPDRQPFFIKITNVKPPFRQEADGVYLGATKVLDNVVPVK